MEKDRLEEAFRLIKEGNDFSSREEHWKAADVFAKAMKLLFQLGLEMKPKNKEEEKIEELYQAQCREYLHRARKSLVDALSKEDAIDQDDKNADPMFITLSEQESSHRAQLFNTLFLGEVSTKTEEIEVQDAEVQQSSLEERLRSLNASLPPALKSDAERMKDINNSLKGLGVNVYSHTDHKNDIDIPVSTNDQVAEVIAQAMDEVRFSAPKESGNEEAATSDEDESLSLESDDDTLSDDSSKEESKLKNKKLIQKTLVAAQVKLSQLLAMLDSGSKHLDTSSKELEKVDEVKKGEKEEREIESVESIGFEPEHGEKLLIRLRKNVDKALKYWKLDP